MDYEMKQRLIALCNRMKEYGYTDGVEELESIFPELAESEDERIRRAIVLGVRRCADAGSIFGTIINNEGVNYSEVLAWLERQKHLYETTKDRFYREGFKEGDEVEIVIRKK